MFTRLGTVLIRFLNDLGEISLLIYESFQSLFKRKVHFRNFLNEIVRLGYDSLLVVITTAIFVAMVFAIQIAREFTKYGAEKVVGGTIGLAIWRELGPIITGVVVAGRVGAAITAELGSMKVTEQIDALKSMGFSSHNYLIAPRFFACIIILPSLTIIADLVGIVAAYFISVMNGINGVSFISSVSGMLVPNDFLGGLLKSVVFGMVIAAISCHQGLTTTGGASGVGRSTTNSVVISLITIFIINYFLSQFLF